MKRLLIAVWGLVFVSAQAFAQLTIEINSGIDNPTPIAVVPVKWNGSPTTQLPENIAAIVSADLSLSGRFRSIPAKDMLSLPSREAQVFYGDWRLLKAEYLVIGELTPEATGNYRLDFALFDIFAGRKVWSKTVTAAPNQLRDMAHYVSDAVYLHLTGIRGVFSTRIAYIEALPGKYRLMLADADGARPQVLFESTEPMVSPAWSPDGKKLAYASAETGNWAIFIQDLATGARQQLTNFPGLNSAPAWSPDGQKLAMTLSKDGNPEIYVIDIRTRELTQVTRHLSIDTEPNWSNDGKAIIFTSERGAKPQIYQVTLATGRVERLTFEGDYNARPRVAPDGKTLVFIHRRDGVYHIASQDIATGDIRVLTQTDLDESPSIAPNGAILMYATQYGGKGILAAVSMDEGTRYRLPSKQGDVREPAWAPFAN